MPASPNGQSRDTCYSAARSPMDWATQKEKVFAAIFRENAWTRHRNTDGDRYTWAEIRYRQRETKCITGTTYLDGTRYYVESIQLTTREHKRDTKRTKKYQVRAENIKSTKKLKEKRMCATASASCRLRARIKYRRTCPCPCPSCRPCPCDGHGPCLSRSCP